jgi:YgiT-type zinc finger domain-containing protein
MKVKPYRSTSIKNKCAICGGTIKEGTTTFTIDYGDGVVVIRDVPAKVCSQCGSDWIEDDIAAKLEDLVNNAKSKHSIVEVISLSA